jgi:sporulation protein YlmC with PRC-barrel domain
MGTQVITRDTGRRLGVVGEVVVDIDRREVVALGLRDNPLTRFLPGLPRWMPLESIRQVGDVILVDSADSLSEGFNPERYSKVINCQVITESGEVLGRVLGFSFDIETGDLTTLVLGALGVPLLGEGVLSTWELAVEEVVSSGPDRIIVYEGAEEKLKQLGTGLLEKLGIGGPSWEQEERERYRLNMVPVENQLAAGLPAAREQRLIQPTTSRVVEPEAELDYIEVDRRSQEPLRQRRYLDEEDERYDREGYGGERGGSGRFGSAGPSPDRSSSDRPSPDRFRLERPDQERFERERVSAERLESERFDAKPRPGDRGGRDPYPAEQPDPRQRFEPQAFDQTPIGREPVGQEPSYRAASPLSERRYRRSQEPLDVEPLDDGEPLPRSRRDFNDPW